MVLLSSSPLPSSTFLENKTKKNPGIIERNWNNLINCKLLVPLILKKIVSYILGANETTVSVNWKQWKKNIETSLAFEYSLCAAENDV